VTPAGTGERSITPPPAVVLAAAWLAGGVPFSQIAARRTREVDLRHVGTGTVSGTGLYQVAGFGPLAVAGIADVGKGALGVLLAGPDRPVLAALAGGLAVVGHNWSPFLRGAGGRGLSPSLGALLPRHWPGTVTLLAGMAGGRLARASAVGVLVADAALVPVLARARGRAGVWAGAAVLAPMLVKRLAGNRRPAESGPGVYLRRLVLDRDTWAPPA